jgi:uncharacterized protein YbaP (TraB family)
MSITSRLLLTWLLLTFASVGWSADDRGLVWKITNNNTNAKPLTAYIFGSIHLAKPDIYPLRTDIEQVFASSEHLVVELDITQQNNNLNAWMQKNGMYKPPESLRNHLSDGTYERLITYLNKEDLPVATSLQQRPALLAITISLHELQKLQLDSEHGLDKHFLDRAYDTGKKIRSLENITDQLNLLFTFPDDELVIQQTLEQTEKLPRLIDDMMQAWKSGNENDLSNLLLETESRKNTVRYQSLMDAMFYQRNHRMADKLDRWFQEGGDYFIVIGSGHLIGRQNLINLLGQRGYSLERF